MFFEMFSQILGSGTWPGSHLGDKTQKGLKKNAKLPQIGGPEAPLAAVWGSVGLPWE